MELKSGGLYETADGRRFRVQQSNSSGRFSCLRSFSGSWYGNGEELGGCGDNDLVREIDERRWVPIRAEEVPDDTPVRIRDGRHWQEQVSRDEARRRYPANHPEPVKVVPPNHEVRNGDTILLSGGGWIQWSCEDGSKVTILLSNGVQVCADLS